MARRKQSKRTTVKDIRTILRLTQEGLSVREISDRRQEQSERRRDHIAELNKRASESELRLKRLYDAIEAGVADIDDPALKDRIDGLKAIRDQAKADTERAQAMLDNSGSKAITPQMVRTFARTARQRIRLEGGGIAATTCARSLSVSKWRTARFGSWDRRPGYFRRSPRKTA